MKVTSLDNKDKYTRMVSVEMTEAEWEAYQGLAAAESIVLRHGLTSARSAAAGRANPDNVDYYWNLDLDWDRLFK